MKSICIIGNSHAACWLAAWRKHRKEMERLAHIKFFVLGGYDCELLQVVDGTLRVEREDLSEILRKTSEGLSVISSSDYDHFVIVSLTSGFRNLTPLFSRYGLAFGALKVEEMTYVSRACLEEAVCGILESSYAIRLRKRLAQISDAPVTLSPSPCQSEAVLFTKEIAFAEVCCDAAQEYLYGIFQSALLRLAEKYNFSVTFQESETMIPGGGYTLAKYNVGGINSAMQHTGEIDTSHMNIEFGFRALLDVVTTINVPAEAGDAV
jgi:hypothetical protein